MTPQDFTSFPEFGTESTRIKPDDDNYDEGFEFGDVLPAEWLNWFLNTMSKGYNELVQYAYEGFTLTLTETPPSPLAPTKRLNVVINGSGVTLSLGNGPWAGYVLPVTAKTAGTVAYIGADGATTDEMDVDQNINYIWQGSYWIVDAATNEKPTYISSSTTVEPKKKMILVIDTASVVLTLDSGPQDGFELPVLCQAACEIHYTGPNGAVTETRIAGDYSVFVWNDSYWIPSQTTPITGIDDNGNPFAFNVDTMVHYDGLINVTGTDADGNPFDYGLGRLVTNADEDNIVTGVEVKTSKTFNGKPVYKKVFMTELTITANDQTVHDVLLPHNISNLDKIINCYGIFTDYVGQMYPFPWQRPLNGRTFIIDNINNTNIIFEYYDVHDANPDINVTLEYTKTTD